MTPPRIQNRPDSDPAGIGRIGPAHEPSAEEAHAERIIELRVSSRPDRLRLVRSMVSEVAFANGCSDRCTRDMVIAVDEACQNVIRHAYEGSPDGEITLEILRLGERLAFNLVDYATPVDVSEIKPRSLDDVRPGGLGTHFISECMDEVGFRTPPEGAGNRLWMTKKIE